jgi:hypothetical protein
MRQPRRPLVVAVVAVGLLAGCGSTVQSRGALQPGNGGGSSNGGVGGTPGPLGQGAGAATDVASGQGRLPGAASGAVASGGGSLAGPGGSTNAASARSGSQAPGDSAGAPASSTTQITIGYVYSSDQSSVGKSLGVSGIVAGDTSRQYRAITDDVNKHGGVLGRKIVLAGYDQSTANELNNPSDEENKECTYFVQDKHVFAVLSSGVYLSPCLAKHGIPSVTAAGLEDPATINQQFVFDGGGMLIDVLAKAFIERLVAEKYFTGWNTATGTAGPAPVKVGLIYQDVPVFRHYYVYIKQAFKEHGISVDPKDEFIYAPTVDSVASQSQAAVLRFSSDGVTHVFGAALLFFKAADNQSYHPRYALDSLVPPALLAQNVGASQLHGALGMGWRPTLDVDQAQDPGPVSPLATKCTNLMRAAGEDVGTRTVLALSHVECEQVWSIAGALTKGGAPTLAALIHGFGELGRPTPTVSFGERWAPNRRASNTTVADLGYDDSCNCFKYTKARTSF